MRIGVFDIETTGFLEEEGTKITEMGMAIWEPESKRITQSMSFLVNSLEEDEEVPAHIVDLTGITTDIVRQYGRSRDFLLDSFENFMSSVDCVMARNGVRFDMPFMALEHEREGRLMKPYTCIDDYLDVEYPEWVKGRTQSHIAADYGFLNPFPHTSLGDVMTLIQICQRAGFDMEEAFDNAQTPVVEVIACVSFDQKDLAKELGFRWDPTKKVWWKTYRKRVVERLEFPFDVNTQEFSIGAIQKTLL